MKFVSLCCALLVLVAAAISATASPQTNFFYAPNNLGMFQDGTVGGFANEVGGSATVEATANALVIATLFGLRGRIDPNSVGALLSATRNGDGGYGAQPGAPSDMHSTLHAAVAFQSLGAQVPDAEQVVSYVHSLLDAESGLFAGAAGEQPSLAATQEALTVLELLDQLSQDFVVAAQPLLRSLLDSRLDADEERAYFTAQDGVTPLVGRELFAALRVAALCEYDFGEDAQLFAAHLFATGPRNVLDTYYLVRSLSTLARASNPELMRSVDSAAIRRFVEAQVQPTLADAAAAHIAVALTPAFRDNFYLEIEYDVLNGRSVADHVVQGTQLKPRVFVTSLASGLPHVAVAVEAEVILGDALPSKISLQFEPKTRQYEAQQYYDTTDKLGQIQFVYSITCFVPSVGVLGFRQLDVKTVGYGVHVRAEATHELTGREVEIGDSVSLGTKFELDVTLSNKGKASFVSGEFDVAFVVVDSSGVEVNRQSVDGRGNQSPIHFAYLLEDQRLPSGALQLRVEVSTDEVVHSVEVLEYQLDTPMVAAQIAFGEGLSPRGELRLGDKLSVTMEPGTFADLRSVQPLLPAYGDRRRFVLDLLAPSGAVVRSIAGVPVEGTSNLRYLFESNIAPSVDSIGTFQLSFRYVTVSGASVPLLSYDSEFGEQYDDASLLSYTVKAELHVVDLQSPDVSDFFYGNEIFFQFGVVDALSGSTVLAADDNSGVYLSLAPIAKADQDRATEVAAQRHGQDFAVLWEVSPNAVQGASVLSLFARSAAGAHIPLLQEGESQEPVSFPVTVGGEIDIASEVAVNADHSMSKASFVATVSLSCREKPLHNAELVCSVYSEESGADVAHLESLPVASNGNGQYSVSWNAEHNALASGQYQVRFYRQVDRVRALEARDEEAARVRLERIQARQRALLAGEEVDETVEHAEVELNIEPLFAVPVQYVALATNPLPFSFESLMVVAFGAVFALTFRQYKRSLA
eukprot:CAMPEP_0177688108 /NCGR_PEP_ID=MMETSP0447-20121125/34486_1 /TAXON_ID=0 /ORGANISM="Stygamoeba regulata, Strain BSH-02190019" /LENGTH=976 /DNA_ID=CAMNT_0019198395 /DNA_START=217 /DNA_END=3147 /DNA_ORIENTATION=-